MMEVIILNLLLLKFSASIIAASRSAGLSCKNQKLFTKVPGQGKCHTLLEKCHNSDHSLLRFRTCESEENIPFGNVKFFLQSNVLTYKNHFSCLPYSILVDESGDFSTKTNFNFLIM